MNGLFYHEAQLFSSTKVCEARMPDSEDPAGACCSIPREDYAGDVSLKCLNTDEGGVANNVCSSGSISELGPIWYSYCSDLVKYVQDDVNPDVTSFIPTTTKKAETITFQNKDNLLDVTTIKLAKTDGQFLQFHLKEKSENVIVYAYSTESVILANNSNLINNHKPLETNIHYNLSAAHGALLVAYVIDD